MGFVPGLDQGPPHPLPGANSLVACSVNHVPGLGFLPLLFTSLEPFVTKFLYLPLLCELFRTLQYLVWLRVSPRSGRSFFIQLIAEKKNI